MKPTDIDPAIHHLMRPEKVCLCRSVSKEDIIKAVHSGLHTFEKVSMRTNASTGCGTCEPQVRKIIADELKKLES